MNDDVIFQKIGTSVIKLARIVMSMEIDSKMPTVTELEEILGVSRGTVQNTIKYLKTIKAVEIKPNGQLGSFLKKVDYDILKQFALTKDIVGTMPLPYSKTYEGFATGIYESFRSNNMSLNMAYMRGAQNRIEAVLSGKYEFAVVSLFAAKEFLKKDSSIEIVLNFKKNSYLSEHVLLLNDKNATGIQSGYLVGIDSNSIDQRSLTMACVGDLDVTLVQMPGHQYINEIQKGSIDAAILNYDEIVDKEYLNLNYVLLGNMKEAKDLSTSVIVVKKNDPFTRSVLEKNINIDKVLEIQNEVKEGKIIPSY